MVPIYCYPFYGGRVLLSTVMEYEMEIVIVSTLAVIGTVGLIWGICKVLLKVVGE